MATLQIRNVPDRLHKHLKQRARGRGESLSEYLREELEYISNMPRLTELSEIIEQTTEPHTSEQLGEPPWLAIERARAER